MPTSSLRFALAVTCLVSCCGSSTIARADQVNEAQKAVQKQVGDKINPYDKDCEKFQPGNGKNVCFTKEFSETILLGTSRSGQKYKDKITEEHATLRELARWNVRVAAVGDEVIAALPCRQKDTEFKCNGFTEQKLTGSEIQWRVYNAELVEGKKADQCEAESYKLKVSKAYQNQTSVVEKSSLASFVKGQDAAWKETFAKDIAALGSAYATNRKAVVDLQAFAESGGRMPVFDAEAFGNQNDYVVCWSRALLLFSELVKETN